LFGKLIFGLGDAGRAVVAANCLDEMILAGIEPNRVTWSLYTWINNAVLIALCAKSEFDGAFCMYRSTRTHSISKEPATLHPLVESFSKTNNTDKAALVVLDMLSESMLSTSLFTMLLVSL
jgi:pentatricopeptide repeat protein